MSDEPVRVSREWLALREPADAAARSTELVDHLTERLPAPGTPLTIHDLGGGTGSMGRWLAPRLPGPQRWVIHDRDPDLLAAATAIPPGPAANSAPVTVEPRQSDITALAPDDLAGADLITASALLDILTEPEMLSLVELWAHAGTPPMLLTLSVSGRVALEPPDPLDPHIAAAFNDHQRRPTARGRLLGPDAPNVAAATFGQRGATVLARPSPWRLGPPHADLIEQWLDGWLAAAHEQDPRLATETQAYASTRREQAGAGALAVTVGHHDLLVTAARQASQRGESA